MASQLLSEILDKLDTGQELLDTNIIKKGDEFNEQELNAKSKPENISWLLTSYSRL